MAYTDRKIKQKKKRVVAENILSSSGPGYLKITETKNQLRARVREPSQFRRFAFSEYIKPGMRFLYGYPSSRLKAPGEGKSRIQAVVFDKDKWTLRQVKAQMKRLNKESGWMK